MLRNLRLTNTNGSGILGTYYAGVLAADMPTGFDEDGLLNNDVDGSDPAGTRYRVEIIDQPSAGVLSVAENGAFSFTGAPDGVYTGATKVYKNSVSDNGSYQFTIGEGGGEVPVPVVTGVTVSPSTATGSTHFDATVLGDNNPSQAVTWATNGGSINSNGDFVEPEKTYSVQTITVTAASVADPDYSGTATVTIAALPPREPAPEFTATRRGRGRSRARR